MFYYNLVVDVGYSLCLIFVAKEPDISLVEAKTELQKGK